MQNTYDNPRKQGGGFQGLVFQGAKEKEKIPPFLFLNVSPHTPFLYLYYFPKKKKKKKERKKACVYARAWGLFFLGDLCYKIMVRTYQLSTEIRVVFFFP